MKIFIIIEQILRYVQRKIFQSNLYKKHIQDLADVLIIAKCNIEIVVLVRIFQ